MKAFEGVLEIVPAGYGFIRQGKHREIRENGVYRPGKDDIYVSPSQIKKLGLKHGDIVRGEARPPKKDTREHYYAMISIQEVNNAKQPKSKLLLQ